jgi:elongation factor 1-gamma
MKVYGTPSNNRVRKILVAGEFAGQSIAVEDFFPRGQPEDVLKEFRKKNPNVKVPVLETSEGCIYESNAILRYLARLSQTNKIYGASKFEQAQVDQWLDWASTLFEPAYYAFVGPHFGYWQFNKDAWTGSREKLINVLKVLEGHLAGKTYLVGSQVTIADINLVSFLWKVYRFFGGDDLRTQLPNVTKWVTHVSNLPEWVKHHGRWHTTKTPLEVFQGVLPQAEEKKAEKKPAEKKPAEPKPKKEAAPAPKKKKDDDDDDDDDMPKEKAAKNPLDSLPPSSFNLFDFKTLFVNAPNKKEALQFFWDNLDDKGYSVWKMDYEKAEGEGTVTFLTANLMNGYLQRLETFRKYAFGVVGVYGDEPNLQIRGCWVWRGTEIPFELKDHPSADWYHFKKLDVKNNEADRKLQEEYWCGLNEDESVAEGLTARIVKYYK